MNDKCKERPKETMMGKYFTRQSKDKGKDRKEKVEEFPEDKPTNYIERMNDWCKERPKETMMGNYFTRQSKDKEKDKKEKVEEFPEDKPTNYIERMNDKCKERPKKKMMGNYFTRQSKDKGKDKKQKVEEFLEDKPTNYIERVMASSKDIPCGPCKQAAVNKKADIWCYVCDEGLCSTCSNHHKRSKGTRDHTIIDTKSYEQSISDIKTECEKHGKQFILYCPSHLMPCCDLCISLSHAKCTGIQSLAFVVETTVIEKSKETVETNINYLISFFDQLVNNKSKNKNKGEHQNISIKKSIGEFRKEINKHLNHLERKLCQEADTIWNQENTKATDFIFEIEDKKKNLKKMKEHLQTVTTHTSKLRSFLGVHQIEQQIHQCQRFVDDLGFDERTKEFDIKMKQNNDVEQMISNLVSIESLGEVTVVKTVTDLNRGTIVRREAQVKSQE